MVTTVPFAPVVPEDEEVPAVAAHETGKEDGKDERTFHNTDAAYVLPNEYV